MIESIRHKGLKLFFEKGNTSKLQQVHVNKIRRLLARLHAATVLEDMQFPGSGLHKLSGNYEGYYTGEGMDKICLPEKLSLYFRCFLKA